MAKRGVGKWPTYLLKDVPGPERRWLSRVAVMRNTSVADVVRSILCKRYRLVCPQQSTHYNADKDAGSTTILLRIQPNLAAALKREAAHKGRSRRRIILETITSHYEKGEPS